MPLLATLFFIIIIIVFFIYYFFEFNKCIEREKKDFFVMNAQQYRFEKTV